MTRRLSTLKLFHVVIALSAGIAAFGCNASSDTEVPVGGTVSELRVRGLTDTVFFDESASVVIFPGLTNESGSTRSTIYFADVSRPASPRLVAQLRIDPIGETSAFFAVPALKRLYLAHFVQGVMVIDYSSPRSPRVTSTFNYPGFVPENYSLFCVAGRYPYLFAPFNKRRLQVYDLSRNPDHPDLPGKIEPFEYSVYDAAAAADTLLLVENGTRLFPVDVSDPSNPVLLKTDFTTDGDSSRPNGVALTDDGRTAWVADTSHGLIELDLSDRSNPGERRRKADAAPALKVSRDGNLIGIARGSEGISLVEERGGAFAEVAPDAAVGFAMNIFLSGNYGYVAMRDGGFKIIRIR